MLPPRVRLAVELTLTTQPPPGVYDKRQRQVAQRDNGYQIQLKRMTPVIGDLLASHPGPAPPALFTNMSNPPNRRRISSISLDRSAPSVTSACTKFRS